MSSQSIWNLGRTKPLSTCEVYCVQIPTVCVEICIKNRSLGTAYFLQVLAGRLGRSFQLHRPGRIWAQKWHETRTLKQPPKVIQEWFHYVANHCKPSFLFIFIHVWLFDLDALMPFEICHDFGGQARRECDTRNFDAWKEWLMMKSAWKVHEKCMKSGWIGWIGWIYAASSRASAWALYKSIHGSTGFMRAWRDRGKVNAAADSWKATFETFGQTDTTSVTWKIQKREEAQAKNAKNA